MPFQPFSWSMRRREMYARCPRAYFYHYYGSAGGAFINCTTLETEKLHLLRAALSLEEYVRKTILSRIRTVFNSGTMPEGDFLTSLEEQFRHEFQEMLWGKPALDHKRPLLKDLTLRGTAPGALAEKCSELLKSQGKLFAENALKELLQIPFENRLPLPFPLKISWNELECYLTPVAAWLMDGCFHAVCTGTFSEENCVLWYFYLLEKYGIPPEKVKIFHFDQGKLAEAPRVFSSSAPFRRIRQDADTMLFLELKLQSAKVPEKLFPRNESACADCRFSSFCFEESFHTP